MGTEYTPKHRVLQDFTRLMFEHNPMQLNLTGNPNAETEYESEALSVLSRFNESALHKCEDVTLQNEVALAIVKQSFVFWFNDDQIHEPESLTEKLLKAYQESYPSSSETITEGTPKA